MINRKRFLQNTGWAVAGALSGVLGGGLFRRDPAADGRSSPPATTPVVRPNPTSETTPAAKPVVHGVESFSQSGEDLIVQFILQYLKSNVTYLDVGANHPTENSNTYYFYLRWHQGVLVEPNAAMCEQLRAVRPRDTALAVAIGVTAASEANYYVMKYPNLNTFSMEEAAHETKVTKGQVSVREVIKVPLLNINGVMFRHFQAAPAFLSIDTEGMDLPILKSIDYSRFRPKVICAETLIFNTNKTRPDIPQYMASQGYIACGGFIREHHLH